MVANCRISMQEWLTYWDLYCQAFAENDAEAHALTAQTQELRAKIFRLTRKRVQLVRKAGYRCCPLVDAFDDKIHSIQATVRRLDEERKPYRQRATEATNFKEKLLKRIPYDANDLEDDNYDFY
ncbi:hypothetical protein PMZ80_009883 [Knufia obscura]|uniref:Uncharacterized protein n=2 Tax=Knufia TaxID=430999 RepID=A0AAN8FCV7_9EURO|nr:hypothetical protein PMZ80_009883 [Knufia obscura]KAK5955976.1 hypothetical protein OHC33_002549 [Knufia fluminis]